MRRVDAMSCSELSYLDSETLCVPRVHLRLKATLQASHSVLVKCTINTPPTPTMTEKMLAQGKNRLSRKHVRTVRCKRDHETTKIASDNFLPARNILHFEGVKGHLDQLLSSTSFFGNRKV
jgi:hypothetical protein